MADSVTIIGGGLAGSEAAYQIAKRGARAILYEMKPTRFSPAHSMESLCELVCSNSLKSDALENASGLLKEEMRILDSLVIRAAEATRVPAGQTLAVDRDRFAGYVTGELIQAGVEIVREEVNYIPFERPLIIATGPLTSDAFTICIERFIGGPGLNFYDAVAPIVYKDSIDFTKAFRASRYNKGGEDYINCPFDRDEYALFLRELLSADRVNLKAFEDMACFEACMPIEAMAQRGYKTLLFGPMRPVGLVDPRSGRRHYAVLQLRRENFEDTLYNMVGFQTRLTFPEQKRVFRLIPGLRNAEFARLGKLHRNTYIDSARLLLPGQRLKTDDGIFFAGQITGVEGYCESAVSGLMAGINSVRALKGIPPAVPPPATMTGALLNYVTDEAHSPLQPMNANFGLLPQMEGKDRKLKQAARALEEFRLWKNENLATSRGI